MQLTLDYRKPFPLLNENDMLELGKATRRVYELMKDGRWHSCTAVIEASEIRDGTRAMRHLRLHYDIEVKRQSDESREFWYKLKEKSPFNDTERKKIRKADAIAGLESVYELLESIDNHLMHEVRDAINYIKEKK